MIYTFQTESNPLFVEVEITDRMGRYRYDKYWKLVLGNYVNFSFPFIGVSQKSGSRWNDVLSSDKPSLYLISDNLKELLSKNNITGWKSFPIVFDDCHFNRVYGYSGLSITGKSGFLSVSNSKIIRSENKLDDIYEGYEIVDWDKSDFFIPKHMKTVHMSERAYQLLNESSITGLSCQDISRIAVPGSFLSRVKMEVAEKEKLVNSILPCQIRRLKTDGQMDVNGMSFVIIQKEVHIINRNFLMENESEKYSVMKSYYHYLCSVCPELSQMTEGRSIWFYPDESAYSSHGLCKK